MSVPSQFFRWGRHYEVGIADIDQQHRQIAGDLNQLFESVQSNATLLVASSVLDRLMANLNLHFSNEERRMRDSVYPGIDQHIADHHALAAKCTDFRGNLEGGVNLPESHLLNDIRACLRDHILVFDQKMAQHLRKRSK